MKRHEPMAVPTAKMSDGSIAIGSFAGEVSWQDVLDTREGLS